MRHLASVAVPLVALSACFFMLTGIEGAPRSARAAPVAITAALAGVAALQLVWLLVSALAGASGGAGRRLALTRLDLSAQARPLAVFGAMCLFTPLVGLFGFGLPSLAFVAAVALICGERVWSAAALALVSVGATLGLMRASGFYFPLT